MVAERRRLAARRRLSAWALIAVVLTAACVAAVVQTTRGDSGAVAIGGTVLMVGLWVYSVIGGVQAARDLRVRSQVVRMLPPPQPARRAVAAPIRPLMTRLDGYSDALRHTVGALGVDGGDNAPDTMRATRDDTLAAADAAEVTLRRQAAELSAMLRAAQPGCDEAIAANCADLEREIRAGVDEYGRLVVAASTAAAASRRLAASMGGEDVAQATERLAALAAGMRELTAATSRPAGEGR